MVQLLALVWRRLLRKRWVLGVVFGLSLIYFLSSTFKQVSGFFGLAPSASPIGVCVCQSILCVCQVPASHFQPMHLMTSKTTLSLTVLLRACKRRALPMFD